jgi:hypothetical protein
MIVDLDPVKSLILDYRVSCDAYELALLSMQSAMCKGTHAIRTSSHMF